MHTTTIEELLKAAEKLTFEERAELIDELTVRLYPGGLPELDPEWKAEIERRCREIEEGTAILVPWEEVKAKLFAETNGHD